MKLAGIRIISPWRNVLKVGYYSVVIPLRPLRRGTFTIFPFNPFIWLKKILQINLRTNFFTASQEGIVYQQNPYYLIAFYSSFYSSSNSMIQPQDAPYNIIVLCKTVLLLNICVIESIRDDQKPGFFKALYYILNNRSDFSQNLPHTTPFILSLRSGKISPLPNPYQAGFQPK